uniref:C2H2-type domain-containing protein n=1 Tax=Cyprinus carpio carpio TaxID=630221 RepID=A0A9J8AWI7_CYPCA
DSSVNGTFILRLCCDVIKLRRAPAYILIQLKSDLVALKEESPELNNVKEEKHLYEKHHNFITANNILVVQTKRSSSRKRAQTTRSRCYFNCQQCGKSFTKKGNLDGHMRIHTGEKPHICPQCGKSFTHQGTLNVHMRIHTGEKPFICHLCGKRFTVKGNLNTHMRVHTREKPFTCLQCEISFTHNKNLKHHLQTHSGKKLQCDEV